MIFRLLVIFLAIAGAYYIIRNVFGNSEYKSCKKCDGKGYWIAMRGEKDKCDICKGSGRIPRQY
ncbi:MULTISPECIES: hypothetical protein [Aquimarina]|uniref:Molecular chaperone DnaJ n=1 Tax=Aquimarina algiphila TaxID=2047982 RepID=A0A554VG66_9FLAO|nr:MULTISPECIES: hypothetical protein [Aquimarina]TSE06350.1 hypothetical protein FOF46_19520 [Aquimarina algiphila]